MTSGPGTIFARYLRDKGIRYENSADTCHCYQLMIDMDNAGPDRVEKEIVDWTRRVFESSKHWYKETPNPNGGEFSMHKVGFLTAMAAAEKFKGFPADVIHGAIRKELRRLILWACQESRRAWVEAADAAKTPAITEGA